MNVSNSTISTLVVVACAAAPGTESGVYVSLRQSVDFTDFDMSSGNEETMGGKLKASYAAGLVKLLAVATAADNGIAVNTPLAVVLSYQHDLSNRSRVSLEHSSVGPDIAGLDASIEGGEMFRHDW